MLLFSIKDAANELKVIHQEGLNLIYQQMWIMSLEDQIAYNNMLVDELKGYREHILSLPAHESEKNDPEIDLFISSAVKGKQISDEWREHLKDLKSKAKAKSARSSFYTLLGVGLLLELVFWLGPLLFSRQIAQRTCGKLGDEIDLTNVTIVVIRLIGVLMILQLIPGFILSCYVHNSFMEILVRSFFILLYLSLIVWSGNLAALAFWRVK